MSLDQNSSKKLAPSLAWLFALGAVVAGIALSVALNGLGQKVTAAVYFAIVAAGGFASTYLTRARLGAAIGAFAFASVAAAVGYYALVSHVVASATTVMADTMSAGSAHAQAAASGSVMGHFFGIVIAVVVFLETIVAGIVGAVAGAKSAKSGNAMGNLAAAATR